VNATVSTSASDRFGRQHLAGERQHAADVVAAGQLGHHAAVGLVHLHLAVQGMRQQARHARAAGIDQRHARLVARRFDSQDQHRSSVGRGPRASGQSG
jgi:hypothetical protein